MTPKKVILNLTILVLTLASVTKAQTLQDLINQVNQLANPSNLNAIASLGETLQNFNALEQQLGNNVNLQALLSQLFNINTSQMPNMSSLETMLMQMQSQLTTQNLGELGMLLNSTGM